MGNRCAVVREKCGLMIASSSAVFSGKNSRSLILLRRITNNLSVTTEFGFHPETHFQFSPAALLPVGKVAEIESDQP
jgi:hypothetical protein